MSCSDSFGANVSIALLHHPVYDKNHQVVVTAITNLDIHDIARAAKTYGLYRYYIVTPVAEQQAMAERICTHWREGWGATYNPKRKAALDLVNVRASLAEALEELGKEFGTPPKIIVTGARGNADSISSPHLVTMLRDQAQPYLLVFGTGWGLTENIFSQADFILEPVTGAGQYNHLSVRSAVSIILDRLFGR